MNQKSKPNLWITPAFFVSWRRAGVYYGISLLAAVLLSLATATWIDKATPYRAEVFLVISHSHTNQLQAAKATISEWLENEGIQSQGCREVLQKSKGEDGLTCILLAPNAHAFFDEIEKLVGSTLMAEIGMTFRGATHLSSINLVPAWAMGIALATYFFVAFLLIGPLKLGQDLRLCIGVILRNPWLLLAPVIIWFLVANSAMLVLTVFLEELAPLPWILEGSHDSRLLRDAYREGIAFMLSPWFLIYAMLLAPVFEEALFRQWLYRKARPILSVRLNAIANAWFFMLAHVAAGLISIAFGWMPNPIQTSPVSIPIWFALGLFFFWVRSRFGSLTLCMVLHAAYNGAMLFSLYFLAFHWKD